MVGNCMLIIASIYAASDGSIWPAAIYLKTGCDKTLAYMFL